MTVHFVYTVPRIGLAPRTGKKAARFIQACGFDSRWIGRRTNLDTSGWPDYSPVSITKHVYEALHRNFHTVLYDYQERGVIRGGAEDILIGHPDPAEPRSIWNRSCERGKFAARIAMFPIHHALADINAPIDRYIPKVDAIWGITGPYWYDTWGESAFAHWQPKITRLDMAIDVRQFPRVKKRFHPRGRRKFLFIGNANPCKGVHLLSILFGLAKDKDHKCLWMGGSGDFPNLEIRRGFVVFTPAFVKDLAEECDFFITMGVSDANPTTILEAMAWGFPVCCTPQSGYYHMPEIESLSTTDMQHNLAVLERLQWATEEELVERADSARRLVESSYTWERFNHTVLTELKSIVARKGLRARLVEQGRYVSSEVLP
jgi:glycosyltransferase involved in cell wall biosynthesis